MVASGENGFGKKLRTVGLGVLAVVLVTYAVWYCGTLVNFVLGKAKMSPEAAIIEARGALSDPAKLGKIKAEAAEMFKRYGNTKDGFRPSELEDFQNLKSLGHSLRIDSGNIATPAFISIAVRTKINGFWYQIVNPNSADRIPSDKGVHQIAPFVWITTI
jgi:hypothetical protein